MLYDIWDSDSCQFKLVLPFGGFFFKKGGSFDCVKLLYDYIAREQEDAADLDK